MSRSTTITCDQCGKVKGESNRWWVRIDESIGIGVFGFRIIAAADHAGISPPISSAIIADLCGEACAQQALAKWMKEHA